MKKLSIILSLLLVLALLAGCTSTTASNSESKAPDVVASDGDSVGTASLGQIGSAERSNQEYVWISQMSTLPLFVSRVYPALDAFAADYGVTVRVSGPTTVDLAAFIATVEQEAAQKPAGMIVVGGWDSALTEPVNRAIEQGVPVIVTDGDLFESNRLGYVGTNWYNLGVEMAKTQMAKHEEMGLTSGKVAIIGFPNNQNMANSAQGIRDTLASTSIEVVAFEDSQSQADIAAQKVSSLIAAYPDLTGIIGLDAESGPGIVAALKETGKAGQLIVTCNEAGVEFLENVKDGTICLVTMERYDVMNYLALTFLYDFHNQVFKVTNPWENSFIPDSIDSGLLKITQENVDEIIQWLSETEG